jgi:hypothetical protein
LKEDLYDANEIKAGIFRECLETEEKRIYEKAVGLMADMADVNKVFFITSFEEKKNYLKVE